MSSLSGGGDQEEVVVWEVEEEEEEEEDGVHIVETACAHCHHTGGGGGVVVQLAACNHKVHVSCCVLPNHSASSTPSPKRQKTSTTVCPVCFSAVGWLDLARGTADRRVYLAALAGVSSSSGSDSVKKALDLVDAHWARQTTTKATATTSKASHKKAAKSSSAYWGAGTGFGGGSGEQVSQSKAKLNELARNDAALSKLLAVLHASLGTSASTTTTEAQLRNSQLARMGRAMLINGPADVAKRADVYSALLCVLHAVAKQLALVPLLLEGDDEEEEEDDVEDEEEEEGAVSLLVLVHRLGEALEPIAPELAEQCFACRTVALAQAKHHPHFAHRQEELSRSLRRVDRGKLQHSWAHAVQVVRGNAQAGKPELESSYKQALQPQCFRTTCLLDLCETGRVSHSFVKQQQQQGGVGGSVVCYTTQAAASASSANTKQRIQRIHQELATLQSSLQAEWNSSVFCIVDENRMDVLQFLIIGPEGTPYQNGCFVFDCVLPLDFPRSPPQILIQTTGGGRVRFNPNLYKDGKVCLSLLNTWAGPSWDPATSTLLQVLISIQSLIMVPDPFFNEPGMENQPGLKQQSEHYNAAVKFNCLRLAVHDMLVSPPFAFDKICRTHFVLKKNELREQMLQWQAEFAPCARGPHASQLVSAQVFNAECSKILDLLDRLAHDAAGQTGGGGASAGGGAIVLDDAEEEEEEYGDEEDGDGDEEDDEVIVIE